MEKFFPPPKSSLITDYYFGQPQETIYSKKDSIFLPKYEDVEHLIKGGKLIQIFGDFEASDKDAKTATPQNFSALAFDLQGRILARVQIPVAIPDHAVYATDAAMVGHIDVKNLDRGFPEHFAAAQIHDFFKQTSRLDVEALKLKFKKVDHDKMIYSYPLELADGHSLELNLNRDGKKFHIGDFGADHKVYGHWQPFNGEKYDDALLAHWNARLGFADLFPSSQKRNNTIRSDVRAKALWIWAFGPQGASGLQLGARQHKRTKRDVLGTRLEDIAQNNSVMANRGRGVEGGIRLYNGSEFDPEKTHTADYDSALTAAVAMELRRLDPQGLRFVEELDDTDKYKKFLQGTNGFTDRPPVGFVHYDQGMLTRSIGVLLATDDAVGKRSKAIMFNLAHDPRDFMNKTSDDIRALLAQRDNEPVFVVVELNKTPTVADFERAYLAGAGNGISPEEYHRRAMMITNNRAFIQRVMENWYDLTYPAPPTKALTQREQYEDSFSHYGEPKYYVYKEGANRRKEDKDIYKRRLKVWSTYNQFDCLINLATQGHAVEYTNDDNAIIDYLDKHKEIVKKLAKHQENWAQPFLLPSAHNVVTLDDARRHLWATREACYDARYSAYNDSWVVNENGQKQPWERVLSMPAATRKRMWPVHEDAMKGKPHYRIQFERNLDRYAHILITQAFTTDKFYKTHGNDLKPAWWDKYFEETWEPSRDWYNAYVTRAVQGPPNLDPSEHRKPSERSEVQKIERVLQAGMAEKSMEYARALNTPQGQKRLREHQEFKLQRLAQYPWTPVALDLMNFDAETKQPTPNSRFTIDRAKAICLAVPDVMLEKENWHAIWGNHHVIASLPDQRTRNLLKRLSNKGASLVLVGQATGMMRLAAKAICSRLGYSADASPSIAVAQGDYATIGQKLGPNPFLLKFEQLAPIHKLDAANENAREKVQHIPLPAQEWAGFADTRAGGLPEPLSVRTGIIVRDVGQEFIPGPVRLRRTQGGIETGDEYMGSIAKVTRITADDLADMKDSEAWRFGKLSAADLHAYWRRHFADMNIAPDQQVLLKIDLAASVNKNTYTYINRAELPIAVIGENPRPDTASRRKPNSPKPGEAA